MANNTSMEAISKPEIVHSSRKPARSKIEVYGDMLRAIGSGAEAPTQVMLKANLSWNAMKTGTQILIEQGLVEESASGGRTLFRLTGKGYELLKKLILISEEMSLPAL